MKYPPTQDGLRRFTEAEIAEAMRLSEEVIDRFNASPAEDNHVLIAALAMAVRSVLEGCTRDEDDATRAMDWIVESARLGLAGKLPPAAAQ